MVAPPARDHIASQALPRWRSHEPKPTTGMAALGWMQRGPSPASLRQREFSCVAGNTPQPHTQAAARGCGSCVRSDEGLSLSCKGGYHCTSGCLYSPLAARTTHGCSPCGPPSQPMRLHFSSDMTVSALPLPPLCPVLPGAAPLLASDALLRCRADVLPRCGATLRDSPRCCRAVEMRCYLGNGMAFSSALQRAPGFSGLPGILCGVL